MCSAHSFIGFLVELLAERKVNACQLSRTNAGRYINCKLLPLDSDTVARYCKARQTTTRQHSTDLSAMPPGTSARTILGVPMAHWKCEQTYTPFRRCFFVESDTLLDGILTQQCIVVPLLLDVRRCDAFMISSKICVSWNIVFQIVSYHRRPTMDTFASKLFRKDCGCRRWVGS